MTPARARLLFVAVAAAPFALFADALLGRAVFYERDVLAYWVPAVEAFVRAVAEGAWPLWDPRTNFGRPILADPSMQAAYPPTWLNLVLSPGAYYALFVAAHCAWAGLGALRLAQAWGLGSLASAWAGVAWMLSGPLLSTATLYHHFASAAWMAWVLVAVEGVLRRPGPRSAAWLALAAAAAALAGSADVCLMTAAAAAGRVAFAAGREGGLPKRASLALAGAGALALLVCAVQWWPTLAHVAVGSRGAVGPEANMYWSLHPAALLDAAAPGLVAELPLGPAWRAAVFESRGPLLRSPYVGLPALALAAVALAAGRWPLRWLAAALVAAFVVCALGRFTPVYPALAGLPVLRLIRFPVKFLLPAALMLALLSAAGVDAVRKGWDHASRPRVRAIAIALAVAALAAAVAAIGSAAIAEALRPGLDPGAAVGDRIRAAALRASALAALAGAALAFRGRLSPPVLAGALALAALDLAIAGRAAVRLGPPELLRHRPPVLDAFARPDDHRVYAYQYGVGRLNREFTRIPAGWHPEWAWAVGHVERLAPPIGTRFGLWGSYDGDFTGLTAAPLSRLTAVVHAARDRPEGARLLRMASVTDVVALEEAPFGPPRFERASVYESPVRVFAVADPLPRAYLVSGIRRDGGPGEASVILEPGFDPNAEVALGAEAGQIPAPPAAGPAGAASIVERRSDRLAVEVDAAAAAVLVVTEGYDAGWRAWVDGVPAPVWRANAIFRAVAVPPGRHRIEMRYRPPSAGWGAAASALGVLAAVALGRRETA